MNPPQPRTLRPLTELKNWEQNPRNISQDGFKRLKSQIELLGQYKPLLVMPDGTVLGGNMRLRAYQELVITNPEKYGSVWVSTIDLQPQADELWSAFLDGMPQAKRFKTRSDGMMEYALSDNDRAGYYDSDLMANLMPEFNVDWSEYAADFESPITLQSLLNNVAPDTDEAKKRLIDEFIIPPFSVFDARQGYWQDRKHTWSDMGIQSELGRDATTFNTQKSLIMADSKYNEQTNISIFDPVLCEIMYKWFCPTNGYILDPFAGGSVRGIVATILGYNYLGIDLSDPQINANKLQVETFDLKPIWLQGDSNLVLDTLEGSFDFIFSCPPYGDLEVYSKDEGDISNMEHQKFLQVYRSIIAKALARLKDDRFAVFVVGDFRDKKGFYRNFVSDTISAFQDGGAILYNEGILITAGGTLALRAGGQFRASRKLGKSHQNVLVFYKGDPSKIRDNFISDIAIKDEESTEPAL